MELHFDHIALHTEQPRGACRSQLTVAGEVTLPGSLREAARVLHADAYAVLEGCEAMTDRFSVSGRVVFRVVYAQGEPEHVDCVEASADFKHLCDAPGVTARDRACVSLQPAQVEASVSGGRMNMRAVLRLEGCALSDAPVEALTGVTGETAMQRTVPVTWRRQTASGAADALLREEFALPAELAVRQTLFARAWPVFREAAGGQGRIGLAGEIQLEAVHASDVPGKPIVVTRHSVPFQQGVETTGEAGELLDGRVCVKDVAVASQPAEDGSGVLRAEILLGLQAWADREETCQLVADAYTTGGDALRLQRETLQVRTGNHRVNTAESAKASLLLPDDAPPVRTVLAVFASPVLTGFEQQGSRLQTEGMLDVTLLYLSGDGAAVQSARMDAAFRMSFAADAAPEDQVVLSITDAEAIPVTGDRLELRYVMHLQTEGVRAQPVTVVTEAQAVPAEAPPKDIVLYYAQPGDSLWDVAKRYRVGEADVRALNPDLTESLKPGQGVVVWRRAAQ